MKKNGGKLLNIDLIGTLVKEDYAHFVPEVERLVKEYDKIRILVDRHNFHGWAVSAAWEGLNFGVSALP
jgi:hypothetical protein